MIPDIRKSRDKKAILKLMTANYLAAAGKIVDKGGAVKTYGEFARYTGIRLNDFGPLRRGERSVPIHAAINACEVFGISYNWMFAGEGEMIEEKQSKKAFTIEKRLDEIKDLVQNLKIK